MTRAIKMAEAEMVDEEMEISEDEPDDNGAEAAKKAAREEERRCLKVKTSKIPLLKDAKSTKTA